MGRLNYTHRRIEGLKLGQVVAKDLLKRIPPSPGHKAAFRDPVVELDMSGKALGAQGFLEIVPALLKSMQYESEQGKVVRLEELCLSGSQLDSTCLLPLASIVSLAANDLKDLDLSGNAIRIATDNEVSAWKVFLESFSECCCLRRIDLNGNELSPRAYEVLTRVYAREKGLDPLLSPGCDMKSTSPDTTSAEAPTRKMSLTSNTLSKEYQVEADSRAAVDENESPQRESRYTEGLNDATGHVQKQSVYTATRGLRSIPFLILHNTSMTETSALHLSYIVAQHDLPELLLAHVPAGKGGPSTQQLLNSSQDYRCRGLVYIPNPQLGPAGLKVLDLAEMVRENSKEQPDLEEPPVAVFTASKSSDHTRRASDTRRTSVVMIDRRRSNSSAEITDHGGYSTINGVRIELDRARSRIQGNALQDAGPCSNDLWHAALKMLTLGRSILAAINQDRLSMKRRPPEDPKGPVLAKLASKTSQALPLSGMPLAVKNPNKPIMPTFGQWRLENSRLVPVMAPDPSPIKPISPPGSSNITVGESYQSQQLPGGLSEHIWQRIMAASSGADEVMSEEQQRSILRWALNRETLARESEMLGLKESAQIWKVLEATGCLTYEMNV